MSDRRLFDDIADLTDNEVEALIGSKRPPKLPIRHAHPVTAQFPSVSAAEFEKLVADVRINGQQKAIAMYEGYIWDGRARYDACVSLGLVPKVFALHREPVLYLIHRHDRYGTPNSERRREAVEKLHRVFGREWKARAKKNRAEWIAFARHDFRETVRVAMPCAICGMDSEYSHAHHSLPLNVQYDLGVDQALHDHDWLCPVHHKLVHRLIASLMTGVSRRHDYYPREAVWLPAKDRKVMTAAFAVFDRGLKLFSDIGGVSPRGNWRMFSP